MPRDSSGNYTLPAGNPVVTGTVITSSWANPTMSDLAAEMTNSLSRNGQGGMLAPLKFADGTVNDPSISFTGEPTLGIFRDAAGVFGIAGLGKRLALFNATIGRMEMKSGINPAVGLFPDGVGVPNFRMFDSTGQKRADYHFNESNGEVNFERFDAGGLLQTRLALNADGNVSVNATVPSSAAQLTRKDYVDNGDLINAGQAGTAQATADQAIVDAGAADANADSRVSRAGDVMTGQLKGLAPSDIDSFTRKDYVDSQVAAGGLPAGSVMLFGQANAPTGWVKRTDLDENAIRIMSSGGGGGGTVNFSTVFGYTTTGAHTLTIDQIPAHTHNVVSNAPSNFAGGGNTIPPFVNGPSVATTSAGGGLSHTHNMDMRVKYRDVIMATKS